MDKQALISVNVHRAVIDFGPDKGKRVLQATVEWRGHGIVAEPQGEDIPELFRRVADAIDAAGKMF